MLQNYTRSQNSSFFKICFMWSSHCSGKITQNNRQGKKNTTCKLLGTLWISLNLRSTNLSSRLPTVSHYCTGRVDCHFEVLQAYCNKFKNTMKSTMITELLSFSLAVGQLVKICSLQTKKKKVSLNFLRTWTTEPGQVEWKTISGRNAGRTNISCQSSKLSDNWDFFL